VHRVDARVDAGAVQGAAAAGAGLVERVADGGVGAVAVEGEGAGDDIDPGPSSMPTSSASGRRGV